MSFRLFSSFEQALETSSRPPASEFYALLARLVEAVEAGEPAWATDSRLIDYAQICRWAIRKLEYSFGAEQMARIEADATTPLRVLDVGCGVVPFCNWVSRRGHEVVAIDPDEDIVDFLQANDLNAVYGSSVDYRVARSEALPFEDGSFDAVSCISVLEHIAPGNDRLALREIARVLKPHAPLIITFDVSPASAPGESPWPTAFRRYADPFSPAAAERLLASITSVFDLGNVSLPAELYSLSWDAVHAFWRTAQQHDGRAEPVREYLAIGAMLRRSGSGIPPLSLEDASSAYLEGQAALEERLAYYSAHAHARLELVQQLDTAGQTLRREVEEKEQAIAEIHAAADARLELAERLQGELASARQPAELDRRLLVLEDRVARNVGAMEQVAVGVARIQATLADQTHLLARLVAAIETGSQPLNVPMDQRLEVLRGEMRQSLAEHVASLGDLHDMIKEAQMLLVGSRVQGDLAVELNVRSLERAKESAEATAEARLRVIEEQKRALDAYSRRRIGDRFRRFLAPRIGVLYQYDPRPLDIPAWYRETASPTRPPTISIVTPSFNQGEFIERTLTSVLDQNYPSLEYIVQDARSSDDSLDILDRYRPQLSSVVSEKDSGFAEGINRGFARASGEILAYLNSDDLLLPGALSYVAAYFADHPEVDVVYGHRVVVDEYDGEIGRWVLPPHDPRVLSWADYVPQETLFWRRRVWDRVGGAMDESLRFAIDWDLLLRFRESGAKMRRLPRFIGAFRVHPHQKTSAEMEAVGRREMDHLRERTLGHRVTPTEIDSALRSYMRKHIIHHKLYRAGVLRY